MADTLGPIIWEAIFGESFAGELDPNKPENEARIGAEKEQRRAAFRQFATGPGKVFFEHVKYGLRQKIFNLVVLDSLDNDRVLSDKIKEIRIFIELLAEAENTTRS